MCSSVSHLFKTKEMEVPPICITDTEAIEGKGSAGLEVTRICSNNQHFLSSHLTGVVTIGAAPTPSSFEQSQQFPPKLPSGETIYDKINGVVT